MTDQNEIPPGVIVATFVTRKYGSDFRLFHLNGDTVTPAASTGLQNYDPFRSAAPEGIHLWEVTLLNFDPVPLDPDTHSAEVPLAGGTLILKGVAPAPVIALVESAL